MKSFAVALMLLLSALPGSAQTRSYADNASKTFVVGLDSYFYGTAGSIDFRVDGRDVLVSVKDGCVWADGKPLLRVGESWEVIIGTHDFTGNREPELVVARRSQDRVIVGISAYSSGRWKPLGEVAFPREDSGDVRIFRQVISVRKGDALYSWTWHDKRFDFKASDGSPDPTSR